MNVKMNIRKTTFGLAAIAALALSAAAESVARPVTPEAWATLRHSLIHRGDGKGRPDNTMEAMLYTWGKGKETE